jgi:hypothetical protein
MQVYWNALTSKTQELYNIIATLPFISEFYLAGGTGLALQLGHRYSVDLDFFGDSNEAVGPEQRNNILTLLKNDPTLNITWDKDGTLTAHWKDVGISFFRLEQHPLTKPTISINGIQVASLEEIGAMKLAALLSRGTRKDYIDLYFILQQIPLKDLFETSALKYPYNKAFPTFAVRALAYFNDAESEPMPRMIKLVKWERIKSFLEKQAMDIGRNILELEKLWPKNE